MLLSNTTLFHPVHAAGTYGYTTLVIFQRKTYLRVKKKECEKYILGENMCNPGLLGVMVATRLYILSASFGTGEDVGRQ